MSNPCADRGGRSASASEIGLNLVWCGDTLEESGATDARRTMDQHATPSWWDERRPGHTVRITLTDPAFTVDLFVATGGQPGPTLAVLAGVHGDEYEGPVAIGELLAALAHQELAGALLAVPVANPPAFAAGIRASPLDGLNLARCFPGDLAGSASQRLAALLDREVIAAADALIDLHSGGVAYEMALLAGYCDLGDATGARSGALAQAFGAPVLWMHPEGAPGRTLSAAQARGIPSLYTEAAGGGAAPEAVVRCYHEGVLRVMRQLGMLPGGSVAPRHRETWRGAGNTDQAIATSTAGLFRPLVQVGEAVTADQPLGEIRGYGGAPSERIVAPTAGVVAMIRRVPRVVAGDGICLLTSRVV
jgi:predicted deacylase